MVFLLMTRCFSQYKLIGIFDNKEMAKEWKNCICGETLINEEPNEINDGSQTEIYIGEYGPILYLLTFNEAKTKEEQYESLDIRKIKLNTIIDMDLIKEYVDTCNMINAKPMTFSMGAGDQVGLIESPLPKI